MAARLWPYPWPLTLLWAVPIATMALLMYVAATEGLSLGSPLLYLAFTLIALCVADAPVWTKATIGETLVRWAFFISEISLLYFGGWFVGWKLDDRPATQLVFEYPSVSAGINEMIGAGFAAIALIHLIVVWRNRRKSA